MIQGANTTAGLVPLSSSQHSHHCTQLHGYVTMHYLTSMALTSSCGTQDLTMDWSFFKPNARHLFLRKELMYNSRYFVRWYCFLLVPQANHQCYSGILLCYRKLDRFDLGLQIKLFCRSPILLFDSSGSRTDQSAIPTSN